MIHTTLSPDRDHPKVSPPRASLSFGFRLDFSVRHILFFVNLFKLLIPYNGYLDKCHTSAFNALIYYSNTQTNKVYLLLNLVCLQYKGLEFFYTNDQTLEPQIFKKTLRK